MTISLRKRSHQEGRAEQGLSLRKPPRWVRAKRKRSSQRGIREMRGNPGKCSALETKRAKRTKEAGGPLYDMAPAEVSSHEASEKACLTGHRRHWRPFVNESPRIARPPIMIPPNVLSLAHSFASFQQALGRDII